MMQTSTGYSTFAPDESSPHDIHRYMQGLKTDFGTFYENDKAVNQWIMRIYWNTLNRALSPTEWIGVTSPQVVNAFNLLSKNSVSFERYKHSFDTCLFLYIDIRKRSFCPKAKL